MAAIIFNSTTPFQPDIACFVGGTGSGGYIPPVIQCSSILGGGITSPHLNCGEFSTIVMGECNCVMPIGVTPINSGIYNSIVNGCCNMVCGIHNSVYRGGCNRTHSGLYNKNSVYDNAGNLLFPMWRMCFYLGGACF